MITQISVLKGFHYHGNEMSVGINNSQTPSFVCICMTLIKRESFYSMASTEKVAYHNI